MENCSRVTKSRSWLDEKDEGQLIILQWNILAQILALNGDFPCPPHALSLKHRFSRIIQEVIHHKPDVVCLQEVDIFNDILLELSKRGYAGIFLAKPKSFCLSFEENHGPDGTAIFYKKASLTLSSSSNSVLKLSDQTETNSVLLRADFIHIKTETSFTVFTTHLKAGSKWSDYRLQQTQSLASELKPINNYILAGDFNGEPGEGFYSILTEQLGLGSAYKSILGTEPAYTTWKKRKSYEQVSKKVEDYIFFHPSTFSCSSILNLPSDDSIGSDLLPSRDYPSDHISLVAKLTLNT